MTDNQIKQLAIKFREAIEGHWGQAPGITYLILKEKITKKRLSEWC